jgi:hypothetical protein
MVGALAKRNRTAILESRRVHIAGVARQPHGAWIQQIARNLVDNVDGFLKGKRYLLHDRDPLFTDAFRAVLRTAGGQVPQALCPQANSEPRARVSTLAPVGGLTGRRPRTYRGGVSRTMAPVQAAAPMAAPMAAAPVAAPAGRGRRAQAVRLQQTIGNQAVLRRVLASSTVVQRQCACAPGGNCGCRGASKDRVQRWGGGALGAMRGPPPAVRSVLGRGGEPVPASLRAPMQERFGIDLSGVQLHRDDAAHAAASALHARAFTSGSHIVFGAGVDLHGDGGRKVLAHELAHVVQQARGEVPSGWIDGGAHDPLERAADAMADSASRPAPAAADRTAAGPNAAGPVADGHVQRTEEDARAGAHPRERATTLQRVDEALSLITEYGDYVPGLGPLVLAARGVRMAIAIWNRRDELMAMLMQRIDQIIQTVPQLVLTKVAEYAARFGQRVVEAVLCIVSQLGSLIYTLISNWRDVLRSLFDDIFLGQAFVRGIPIIIENLGGLVNDLRAGNLRSAVDRGIAIMTEFNAMAGIVFLIYLILSTVVGTILGTVEPGGGNAAGAAAGVSSTQVINMALIASVIATEAARIGRGVQEMIDSWDNPTLREAACRRIAEGVFTLVITGALFFIGPYVSRFARTIIQRAVALVRSAAAEFSAFSAEFRALLQRSFGPQFAFDTGPARFSTGEPHVEAPTRPRPPPVIEQPQGGGRPRPRPAVETPVEPTTSRAPQPQPQPQPRPRPASRVVGSLAPQAEDPERRLDPCLSAWGLARGINARRHVQRPPLPGPGNRTHITVSQGYLRLDRGRPSPDGQGTTDDQRIWVRLIGRGYNDPSGRPPDDAGHTIARRFGGTRAHDQAPDGNIFPQDRTTNRGMMREYDRRVADVHDAGCDVCARISLVYGAATALRPIRVAYTYMYQRRPSDDFTTVTLPDLDNP